MKSVERNVVLSLSLLAGLVLGVGLWVQGDRARAAQRHDLWLEYLRGPLTQYVQGSREGAQALLARPGPRRDLALGDALQDLNQACSEEAALKPGIQEDAAMESLGETMQWFNASEQTAEAWPIAVRRGSDQVAAVQSASEAVRRHLSLLSNGAWAGLSQDPALDWTPAEQAESRALLALLGRPLPQKQDKRPHRHRLRRR